MLRQTFRWLACRVLVGFGQSSTLNAFFKDLIHMTVVHQHALLLIALQIPKETPIKTLEYLPGCRYYL